MSRSLAGERGSAADTSAWTQTQNRRARRKSKGTHKGRGTGGNLGRLPSTETNYLHEEPARCLLGPYLCYCLAATSSGHYLRSTGGSIG